MRRSLPLAVTASAFFAASAQAQSSVQQWPISASLDTGNQYCGGFPARVREEGGTFTILSNQGKALGSIPMAADGSASGEFKMPIPANTVNSGIMKVTVPPGHGPRDFQMVNLQWGCRYTGKGR